MPPISIKYVVSFTSQDDRHPVSNIVVSNGYQKWLSHPQEKCGQTEAVFQLDHPCIISYIDIGSIWCATLELKVGRSEWPAGREFETLVYTVSLMTPADCLNNRNPNKTQMFSSDLFCQDVAKKEWDRVKVVCRQPYKKLTQFGLSFLRIKSTSSIPTVPAEKQQGAVDSTSVRDIQKHFLGKLDKSKNDSSTVLKSKLLKIAASSDGGAGVENTDALSRTAKLVLAASGNKSKSYNSQVAVPTSEKHRLYSSRVEQNYEQEFVEEVFDFMKTLVIDPKQLDSIKLSDLRHKLEKKKRRKLTKEEKKIFIEAATKYLTSAFREKKLTSPKQSPANSKNSVTSSSRVDIVISNQNVVTNNSVKSNPTVGTDRPKAKRKLEDDSITPPPSKMMNNNKNSPNQKSFTSPPSKFTNKTSLIQKMKSIENIPVKRDMIGDLKKVQQNGPITTCVTSPSTPYQYKGLRGREADIENEATPKMTSCAKPLTPNSTSAKKRTPKANFKMNFDLSSDDDDDLDTYMLATDNTNNGRGRGCSTRGKNGRGRGAKGTGRGRGNKNLSFEPGTPRNTDEPPWLSAKPATPQGSGNGTPDIRANNNNSNNNAAVTSPPWLLAAENRLQQQQPTNIDKPTSSISKKCAESINNDSSFSTIPSEAQQNGTPSQEEWNNDTQDQSQSQSLLKRSNSQRKQKSGSSQHSAKKNRRKSSVLQIKFSAIDISSDDSDDDGGFRGRVSCAKGGVSSAKGGVSSAKGGLSSVKGGVSSVRDGSNRIRGGVNSVKGGASSVRGGDNSFGGGANCVKGGASSERGGACGVVNDCVIKSTIYTNGIDNGHIESMIACPLCGDDYPQSVIEFHAAQCYL